MLLFLILGLLLGAVTVIFALQNISEITVTFFAWQVHGSLALVLLLAVASGILVCILISLPEVISTSFEIARLRKQNKKNEDELASLKKVQTETSFQKTESPSQSVTVEKTITTEAK